MSPTRAMGRRILTLLGVAAFAGIVGLFAPGDTFATGSSFTSTKLDLKIDSKAWYNGVSIPSATWALKDLTPGTDKFFNLTDVKPGDFGCNVISIHAQKSDAYACIDFKNLKNDENGMNEPEASVDSNGNVSGELAAGTEFYGWIDDGDGKFEPPSEKAIFGTTTQDALHVLNNKTYVIGDSKGGGSCKQDSTKYVGMCYCAGNLTVNPSTGKMTCDGGALGNSAQTDSFSVDVLIRAVGTKDDPKFVCGDKPPKSGGEDDKKSDDKKKDDGKNNNTGKGDDSWHQVSNNRS